MRCGYCSWCRSGAEDVVLVSVIEQGSGPGGGVYACLPCARTLVDRRDASAWYKAEVAAMERRFEQRAQGTA